MQFIKIFGLIIFIFVLFFWAAPKAQASEGTVELRNTIGQNARCFAASVLMTDFNYSLVVSCRDLIYPPASDMFSYGLWANALSDGKPVRLGELGFGKAFFQTNVPFSRLFVTKERAPGVNSPSDLIVMQGTIQTINFLEGTPSLPPVIEIPSPTPTPTATGGGELASSIRRAVITLFIALLVIAVIVVAIILTLRRFRE